MIFEFITNLFPILSLNFYSLLFIILLGGAVWWLHGRHDGLVGECTLTTMQ